MLKIEVILDDAGVAAIAAAVAKFIEQRPPVTPPPVARKLHYGYYGAPTTSENEDHTTFTFAPGWDGSGLPLTRPTVLFAPFGEPLDATLQKVKEQGGLHHIIALYPIDEPDVAGKSDEEATAIFNAARAAARAVGLDPPPPIMVCYGAKGFPGIAAADIIGQDKYGSGPVVVPVNEGQRRFYIPGAADPWKEDPVAFAEAALADPLAWGVVSFIWVDQWGGENYLGVKSNGTVGRSREAFVKLGGVLPAPVEPKPKPTPTEPFDEAYYLEANPDVAAAIPQYFVSGWDHYDRCGRAEGRPAVRPVVVTPPPVPVPLPEPPPVTPPPAQWEPRATYPSIAALREDLKGKAFSQYVAVDGVEIQSGFGPAYNFFMWRDGSIRREQPSAPPRKVGDPLLASYDSTTALLEDAAAVGWEFALQVDGVIVKKGFEPDNRADMVYVTRRGKVVRA